MKRFVIIGICYFFPTLLQAQITTGSLPRWYVGTDAYIRQENFIVEDPGGQVAPSDHMWNFSYGLNVGYRPTQWLAVETGIYRFTYADRLFFFFNPILGSYATPWRLPVVPVRVYVDPFNAGNFKLPHKLKVQLMGGMSWGQYSSRVSMGSEELSGPGSVTLNPDHFNEISHTYRVSRQLLTRQSVNVESGVNVLYRVNERVLASATYGYTFGLNTMVEKGISYQLNTPNGPTYEATQSSKGSGQTLMIGLKYGFGK
jgi:hypothetical protein